jgi:hypothetical protein
MSQRNTSPKKYRIALALLAFLTLAASSLPITTPASAAGKKPKITTPTITCAGSTQASISLQVCAPASPGATGLPAGFTIQWTTAEQFALGPDGVPGTSDDNSWGSSDTDGFCDASFSGNAHLSRYNLAAGECVIVNVGDFLFDEGASTSCPDALVCGTDYVFRAFGHATSDLMRSDFTANRTCSTLACQHEESCTFSQGYWKTHGPTATGNNSNEWPVSSLTLGNVTYTDLELQAILDTPAAGNGLISLAHQLIAAKLNVANGADDSAVASAIASADTLIGNLVIPPVGGGSLSPSATSSLTTTLTNYNEGLIGPGHCE